MDIERLVCSAVSTDKRYYIVSPDEDSWMAVRKYRYVMYFEDNHYAKTFYDLIPSSANLVGVGPNGGSLYFICFDDDDILALIHLMSNDIS